MTRPIEYSLTFSGAGERELQVNGKYLYVNDATGDVFISLDNGSELQRGKKSNIANGDSFTRLRVRSAIAQTVRLTVSEERQDEGRDDVNVTVSATLVPGNTFETAADYTPAGIGAEQVLAADADRLAVTLTNPSTNTGVMRAGGSAADVGAARGAIIEPGQSITRAYNGAVWVYFPVVESVAIDSVKNV
jgi:hypothetical protein